MLSGYNNYNNSKTLNPSSSSFHTNTSATSSSMNQSAAMITNKSSSSSLPKSLRELTHASSTLGTHHASDHSPTISSNNSGMSSNNNNNNYTLNNNNISSSGTRFRHSPSTNATTTTTPSEQSTFLSVDKLRQASIALESYTTASKYKNVSTTTTSPFPSTTTTKNTTSNTTTMNPKQPQIQHHHRHHNPSQYLHQTHTLTLQTILTKQQEKLHQQIKDKLIIQNQNDWNEMKATILSEIKAGHRLGGGGLHLLNSRSSNEGVLLQTNQNNNSNTLNNNGEITEKDGLEMEQYWKWIQQSIHSTRHRHSRPMTMNDYSNYNYNNDNHSDQHPSKLPTFFLQELLSFQKQQEEYSINNNNDYTIASSSSSSTATSPYQNAIQLLLSSISSSSSSSSKSIHNTPYSTYSKVMGSLSFLSNQYRDFIRVTVFNATSRDGSSSSNSSIGDGLDHGSGDAMVEMICKFVEIQVGKLNMDVKRIDFVWMGMYYCLRCGDAISALKLSQSTHNEMDQSILDLLSTLSQYQSTTTTYNTEGRTQSTANAARNLFSKMNLTSTESYIQVNRSINSIRRNIQELYIRALLDAKQQNHYNSHDLSLSYRIAVLSMLSLAEEDSTLNVVGDLDYDIPSDVINTIEDYLYHKLWKAIHPIQNSAADGDVTADVESYAKRVVVDLAQTVKEYGQSYFQSGDDDESGWSYTMPLLFCQQYESALLHLAQCRGGLCPSVHLTIGLWESGILVKDLTIDNDSSIVSFDEHKEKPNFFLKIKQLPSKSNALVDLIVHYSKRWVVSSPIAALDYLVCIPDFENSGNGIIKKDGRKIGTVGLNYICDLILDTVAYDTLAGRIDADGSRDEKGAALDLHFSPNAVCHILGMTAENAMKEGRVADAAELLALSGRYSDLLTVVNRELATVVADESDNENRLFWRQAALKFHASFLTNGRTRVLEVLENEGTVSLGNVFQLLLNLMTFFDLCRKNDWQNAWELMDNLHIFPTKESELPMKLESFHSLSDEIKSIFHQIVLKTMDALYNIHSSLKSNVIKGQQLGSTSAAYPSELRSRARLLVTMAGLVPMKAAQETRAKIGRMEAVMV